ncbi:XRE family transcriptional regulator [Clostridium sp. AF19-22AC]|jgi:transcriptional regulator with XRE-family HTH domain|uniref:Helix-turn-helix protein n=1 Tax=Faecalicatena orotica TaxID=1544 RepID=A0A2Y9BEZ8_9FIRM|nr:MULTISPECIES: helix-turn-helix transcriptional regulator [Clostridia]PWJ28893.1 helix-turn-helix protein [Faecalicatena orotica]RHR33032.1 XRE family transcriptional regulator [Clostridium sp. AF19-22AC]SSA56062.1 Helix-turn-helix [Faecalicatena orotica]
MSGFPMIDMVRTGENILKLRQQKKLSVKELQLIFGFETPQAIYKWQHGTALPTVDNLVILSIIFEVKMEDILVLSEKKEMKMCERYLRYVFS